MWEKKIISFEVCLILSFSWQPKEHMCLFPAAHASSKCLFAICWKKKNAVSILFIVKASLCAGPYAYKTKVGLRGGFVFGLLYFRAPSVPLGWRKHVGPATPLPKSASESAPRDCTLLVWNHSSLAHALAPRSSSSCLSTSLFFSIHTHTHTHVTKRPRAHLHL